MARRWLMVLAGVLAIVVVSTWRLSSAPTKAASDAAPARNGAVLYRCTMPECGDVGSTDPTSRCPVCGMKREPVAAAAASAVATPWYRCPMGECNDPGSADPESRCPACGMKRQPVEPEQGEPHGELLEVSLSPRALRLAEVATEPLLRGPLFRSLRAVGQVEVDERRRVLVTSRLEGTIERLTADQTGMRVHKGDHLLEIFSLELLDAQNALLRLKWGFGRIEGRGRNRSVDQDLVTARYRLELLGMTTAEVDAMLESDHENPYLVVTAPLEGTVLRKGVSAGQYVRSGDLLFELADLDQLWVQLECYEDDLPWIRLGQEVALETRALPGESVHGRVSFIAPDVNPSTRTARVRVEVANRDGRLRPGMYVSAWARAAFAGAPEGGALRVPREAVLEAGERSLVYVEVSPGKYRGVDVRLGPLAEDENGVPSYQVLAGLEGSERVVTRGGFAIDSQAQIEGKQSLFASGAVSPGVEPGTDELKPAAVPAGIRLASAPLRLEPRVQRSSPEQKLCPVLGNPVDPTVYVDYRGVRVYFCCHLCTPKFLASPEKFVPNLPQAMQDRIAAYTPAP